ncbi:MAG: AAA family ATPase [Deltaproteobacteria bacterium]|nr:AAA family ATPase [Deltaproteobacteria bacterium]
MSSGAAILYLPGLAGRTLNPKYRNSLMLKQELILRNPLRHLGFETEEILAAGSFGAVLANAGVGKTALLVQLALNGMLRSRNVLHISLNDPVNKVTLWYRELFQHLAGQCETPQIKQLWDSLLPHRFIMTFRVESFTVPKLEERLNDLTVQGIFKPEMMIIDGLHCDPPQRPLLEALKALAKKIAVPVWFTVHTHSNEKPGPDGLPVSFATLADLFDLVLELQTNQSDVHIKALRGIQPTVAADDLLLDPSTMLIKNQA